MYQFKLNQRVFIFVMLLFVFLITTSCATVFSGKMNTITVHAGNPEKAVVFLDGEYLGETPLKMRISKYKLQHGSLIEIRKKGYETARFQVTRRPHKLYVVADILTGFIPLIIDTATGNIYRPHTSDLSYELLPLSETQNKQEIIP